MKLVLILACAALFGCAHDPRCGQFNTVCSIGYQQIEADPEKYRADLSKRTGQEIRYRGQRTGLTIDPK